MAKLAQKHRKISRHVLGKALGRSKVNETFIHAIGKLMRKTVEALYFCRKPGVPGDAPGELLVDRYLVASAELTQAGKLPPPVGTDPSFEGECQHEYRLGIVLYALHGNESRLRVHVLGGTFEKPPSPHDHGAVPKRNRRMQSPADEVRTRRRRLKDVEVVRHPQQLVYRLICHAGLILHGMQKLSEAAAPAKRPRCEKPHCERHHCRIYGELQG